MSAYIDARGGEGRSDRGHDQAAKHQNHCAEKVRAVLGFQHLKADLDFLMRSNSGTAHKEVR